MLPFSLLRYCVLYCVLYLCVVSHRHIPTSTELRENNSKHQGRLKEPRASGILGEQRRQDARWMVSVYYDTIAVPLDACVDRAEVYLFGTK